jgi:hypothetical protein
MKQNQDLKKALNALEVLAAPATDGLPLYQLLEEYYAQGCETDPGLWEQIERDPRLKELHDAFTALLLMDWDNLGYIPAIKQHCAQISSLSELLPQLAHHAKIFLSWLEWREQPTDTRLNWLAYLEKAGL